MNSPKVPNQCRCMTTQDSTSSPSPIDVSAASSTAVALSKFDVAALRRDFLRLSVDDLSALASFPVEPHELIGRVVAVTHCLLLSLSVGHSALELRPPPWPLLRLQLLNNTLKIWKRLRKRAWQLEAGAKALSPVQIRFGCNELIPFIVPSNHYNDRCRGTWEIERLAQVSTIAASLGAWVVFCLCCSVLSPSSMRLRVAEVTNPSELQSTIQSLPKVSLQHRPPQKRDPVITPNSPSPTKVVENSPCTVLQLSPTIVRNQSLRCSRRIGIKIGGHFLLYHTRFPGSRSAVDPVHVHTLGKWSVYCLDGNRIGRQQQTANASWWKPSQAIETKPAQTLHSTSLCHMPPFAQHSLLLQLGFHEHIFERPVQNLPYVKTPRCGLPAFTLKFAVVTVNALSKCSLQGVGNALTSMQATVADLRRQVIPSVTSRLFNRQVDFRFMYRGSFLAVSQERHLATVTLLPFAMLVVAYDYQAKILRPSQLWRHHCDVAQALVNAGLPDHIPQTENPEVSESSTTPNFTAAQVFIMHQPLAASTSSVIVDVFKHWRAFVNFQQLQDSSVLFQLPQHSPKKPTIAPHRSPKHRQDDNREDSKDESVPYGPLPQPLPRKKFNSNKEWLLPLYALVDVLSPTAATMKTPFHQDVERSLSSPCRLVLVEEANVIHFTRINTVATERDDFGINTIVEFTFMRDESCPLESLLTLKGVYAWLIVPRNLHKNRELSPPPTEWVIDLYRFVQHPTYDFQSVSRKQANYFRVCFPLDKAERAIEAAFWSKGIDWTLSMDSTDLYSTVLRQLFNTLSRSHPPALGVDSVKFSKLLYEAEIQPTLLSIGDAAFLFASNVTPGNSYEMDFDGFIHAMEWLAQQFYSKNTKKGKSSPRKTFPGIQHTMMEWKLSERGDSDARDRLLLSLRRFCYETLVHLPSLAPTWREIMDSWRRDHKQQLLQEYTLRYCAASRLQASWRGLVAWRIFLKRRQRMREERLAATKLQSLTRGRQQYLEYHRVRRIVIRTQLRIHAHSELRRLRAERAVYVERMRVRIVNWMRLQLWLLRQWKRLNAPKIARRDRIREKRQRRLGVAVFPLDGRYLRFSLYRPKAAETAEAASNDSDQIIDEKQECGPNKTYELEVVDSTWSWGHVLSVSQEQIDHFIVEESDHLALQLRLGFATEIVIESKTSSSVATPPLLQNTLSLDSNPVKASIVRDSVVHPVMKPNITFLALARRLFLTKDAQQNPVGVRYFSDPADTSLGKLVFKGAIRSEFTQDGVNAELLVQRHVVKVLEWAGTFKILMYTPATSTRRRYDLDTSFILTVLQFSRFQSMRLNISEEDDASLVEDKEGEVRASGGELSQSIPYQIHRVLNGSHRIVALQCILGYVLRYGTRTPTYSMMPDVIAERERRRQERELEQRNAILIRERQLIVKVQARMRQLLARTTRLQLALVSYSKQFDRESGRFVYVFQRQSKTGIVLGERKPFSLFDRDVSLPPDEWQLVSTSEEGMRFFNPRRGIYSPYNNILAASVIQRWFRGKMWAGINNWNLRDIVHALRYHSDVHKPKSMTDPGQLENLKRYGLQLHVLEHQYKAAHPIYEAALKLSPDDPQTLVCLAILLVISCRYPVAKSWQRAMEYLQQARNLVSDELANILHGLEQNGFRWALLLQPKNPHAIANYAAYLQCVHIDIDKAEILYRRALDLDPADDLLVTNFQRLQSERAPSGTYAFAGPGKIALSRSKEIRHCGPDFQWREMEDPGAQTPMPQRFFHNLRTGECAWELPTEDLSIETPTEPKDTMLLE